MSDDMLLRVHRREQETQENPVHAAPRQETKNAYFDAMNETIIRNAELQESKFSFWGVTHADRAEMKAVKQGQRQLIRELYGEMPTTLPELNAQIGHFEQLYDQLIADCGAFLTKFSGAITRSRQEQVRLVRLTLESVRQERLLLRESARAIFERTGGRGVFWINVLGEMRTSRINLDEEHVEMGGAGTSEVTIIGEGEHKTFFKDEEQLISIRGEYDRTFLGEQCPPAQRAAFEKLRTVINDNMNSRAYQTLDSVSRISQPQARLDAIEQLMPYGEYHIDWKDQAVQQAFEALLPRLSKWQTRKYVCQVAGIDEGTILSTRNVATSRMAKLLNMPQIVAESKTVTLEQRGRQLRKGNLMDRAKGIQNSTIIQDTEAQNKEVRYTPEALRQMVNLQVMDTLCAQVDRNLSNFCAVTETVGKTVYLKSIQGIDNDMAFGKLSYQEVNSKYGLLQCLPHIEVDGHCTLRALDADLVAAVCALTDETVIQTFADLLQRDEISALLSRLHGLKELFRRTGEEHPEVIVPPGEWNQEVVKRFEGVPKNIKSYVDQSRL